MTGVSSASCATLAACTGGRLMPPEIIGVASRGREGAGASFRAHPAARATATSNTARQLMATTSTVTDVRVREYTTSLSTPYTYHSAPEEGSGWRRRGSIAFSRACCCWRGLDYPAG